ncbi:UvrD-helicase domain-containing protein [Marmoricola sp. URHB0036]|uniref:UvrD-helicase domain-containing protein n=1 Tax=Marmoricola sp. URHB0036 TaxID=1298863 RepID=UPI00040270E1|nr:UvrD-helicase domain-containing protein [Marmoricola sp. URHB0036]
MPQIILGPQQHAPDIDGSVRGKAYAFLEKLAQDDTRPGLHMEPIGGSLDSRVRTGRVDQFWRAVLFKVQGQADAAMYVYLGVWPHDDAIAFAQQARLQVNPVNGIAELLLADGPAIGRGGSPSAPATAPAPDVPSDPLLVQLGHTASTLVEDLGLDPALVELAMEVRDPDEITVLAEAAAGWQGVALVDLVAGRSIEQVRESLGIDDAEPATSDDDATLAKALTHPASRMEFAFVEDDAALRRAIEDADFEAWRVFLHPEQRKYVERSWNGPFRLSGGAGTGKTVVLLHRARRLAREHPEARILLTTFNKTLAEAMQRDLRVLDPALAIAERLGEPGVLVRGVDAVARAVRQACSRTVPAAVTTVLGSRTSEVGQVTGRNAWRDAIATAGAGLAAELRSAAFFEAEYVTVVLPNRVTTYEEYAKVRRQGRGVSLDRQARSEVWKVVTAYRLEAGIRGSLDFSEAAAVSAEAVLASGDHPFDHVLVDEGQDLGPARWQLLRALVEEKPDDLFIAEDSHQRIYGHKVVLGRYGVRIVGRSQRLRLNYRTTAQNLRYAVSMLTGTEFVDLEDQAEDPSQYRSARTGPPPSLLQTGSPTAELDTAVAVVRTWLDEGVTPETIGLLVRSENAGERLVRALDERGIDSRFVSDKSLPAGKPVVMTMHRAKGMEFSRVLITGADAGSVPAAYALRDLPEAEREDALLKERSLLYVAATRARDELVVVWSGEPSELLPIIPEGA